MKKKAPPSCWDPNWGPNDPGIEPLNLEALLARARAGDAQARQELHFVAECALETEDIPDSLRQWLIEHHHDAARRPPGGVDLR